MKQLPMALPDDGLFDISFIRPISWWRVLRSMKKLYDGSHVALPEVSMHKGKSVQIDSAPACWVEADGEVIGKTPVRFEILAQAVKVVVG
jgi:diacylglycerol kinase family enzyme